MRTLYQERTYRNLISGEELVSFEVRDKETDLHIQAEKNLSDQTGKWVRFFREEIESYIVKNPIFLEILEPYDAKEDAPEIVKNMAAFSGRVGVGPMASVAGAISEYLGKKLLCYSKEVIIENGGDIFISSREKRRVAIYAGDSPFSMKIGFELSSEIMPLGVCTSSGTVGHSLSFGKADAVVVISSSTILADAAATAICNRVKEVGDIEKAIEWSKKIKGLTGIVIIKGDRLGVWGGLELIRL